MLSHGGLNSDTIYCAIIKLSKNFQKLSKTKMTKFKNILLNKSTINYFAKRNLLTKTENLKSLDASNLENVKHC